MHSRYHEGRIRESRQNLLGLPGTIPLNEHLQVPLEFTKGLVKCRMVYSDTVHNITFSRYKPAPVRSLKIVHSDTIDYSYKYEDRSGLDILKSKREKCDDILIVKNHKISNTSFTNLVLYDGYRWVTPAAPLLNGTCRQRLLEEQLIIEDDIHINDLERFTHVSLINAMLDPGECVIPVCKIT